MIKRGLIAVSVGQFDRVRAIYNVTDSEKEFCFHAFAKELADILQIKDMLDVHIDVTKIEIESMDPDHPDQLDFSVINKDDPRFASVTELLKKYEIIEPERK